MPIDDPIEPSLQSMFEVEKLSRMIQECNDINSLRDISMELLSLYQKKSAIAYWATRRAAEAEERELRVKSSHIKGLDD